MELCLYKYMYVPVPLCIVPHCTYIIYRWWLPEEGYGSQKRLQLLEKVMVFRRDLPTVLLVCIPFKELVL